MTVVEEQILGVAVLEDLVEEGLVSGVWSGVPVEEVVVEELVEVLSGEEVALEVRSVEEVALGVEASAVQPAVVMSPMEEAALGVPAAEGEEVEEEVAVISVVEEGRDRGHPTVMSM